MLRTNKLTNNNNMQVDAPALDPNGVLLFRSTGGVYDLKFIHVNDDNVAETKSQKYRVEYAIHIR